MKKHHDPSLIFQLGREVGRREWCHLGSTTANLNTENAEKRGGRGECSTRNGALSIRVASLSFLLNVLCVEALLGRPGKESRQLRFHTSGAVESLDKRLPLF